MPRSFACLHYHIVFGTKDRQPHIAPDLAAPLYAYMAGAIKGIGGKAILIGGAADHVHILAQLGREGSIADAVRDVKAGSTKWVHQTYPQRRDFAWQDGYGAFTIGYAGTDRVKAYIAGQEAHHREVSFREEFVSFLRHHGIAFDERDV
jgi:putative transposase